MSVKRIFTRCWCVMRDVNNNYIIFCEDVYSPTKYSRVTARINDLEWLFCADRKALMEEAISMMTQHQNERFGHEPEYKRAGCKVIEGADRFRNKTPPRTS